MTSTSYLLSVLDNPLICDDDYEEEEEICDEEEALGWSVQRSPYLSTIGLNSIYTYINAISEIVEVHIYQELPAASLFDFSLNAQSKCDGGLDGITLIGIKF